MLCSRALWEEASQLFLCWSAMLVRAGKLSSDDAPERRHLSGAAKFEVQVISDETVFSDRQSNSFPWKSADQSADHYDQYISSFNTVTKQPEVLTFLQSCVASVSHDPTGAALSDLTQPDRSGPDTS